MTDPSLSVLPEPPEGLVVFRQDIENNWYMSTGFFPPGVARKKENVEQAPVLFVDADLKDYVAARRPDILEQVRDVEAWIVPEVLRRRPFLKLRKQHREHGGKATFVQWADKLVNTPAPKGRDSDNVSALIKAWLHTHEDEDELADLLDEHLDVVYAGLKKITRLPSPTVITRSGYGYHLFWWLLDGQGQRDGSPATNREAAGRANKALVTAVNTQIGYTLLDPQITTPGYTLCREIGSLNVKGLAPREVVAITHRPQRRLDLRELLLKDGGWSVQAKASSAREGGSELLSGLTDAMRVAGKSKCENMLATQTVQLEGDEEISIADWFDGDEDDAKIACPFGGGGTVGSARMWRMEDNAGVWLTCFAGHHGHTHAKDGKAHWIYRAPDVRESATSEEARSVIDHLDIGENGKPRAGSLGNIRAILEHSPEYAGRLWWSDRLLTAHIDDEQLSDEHVVQMQIDMEALYGVLERSKSTVKDMAVNLARTNRRNEVKEMIESEEWDGTDRASTWLTTVLGVEDTELHRAYARKFLISLCARVYDPGCKVDQVLLLSGAQGMKKSSVFEILAGRRWFSDSRMDLDNKDSYMQLFRALIYEWSENHKAGSGAVEQEKAFITSRVDSFRPPYASDVRSFDRHTIIVATTNLPYPLTDPTGNRRWWPVTVTKVADAEWLKANRSQLLAEALVAYKSGELHYFDENSELADMRRAEAEAYTRDDPRMDKIRQWARTDSAPRTRGVTVAEVTERVLDIHASDLHKHATVVGQLLRDCGFVRLARRIQKDGTRSIRWLSPHIQLPEGDSFESAAEQARHAAQYSPLETSARRGVVLPLTRKG